jgi:hypothetical protein
MRAALRHPIAPGCLENTCCHPGIVRFEKGDPYPASHLEKTHCPRAQPRVSLSPWARRYAPGFTPVHIQCFFSACLYCAATSPTGARPRSSWRHAPKLKSASCAARAPTKLPSRAPNAYEIPSISSITSIRRGRERAPSLLEAHQAVLLRVATCMFSCGFACTFVRGSNAGVGHPTGRNGTADVLRWRGGVAGRGVSP